jgi:hypothetical protein
LAVGAGAALAAGAGAAFLSSFLAAGAAAGAAAVLSSAFSFSGAMMAAMVCSGGRRTETPSGSLRWEALTASLTFTWVMSWSILTGIFSGRQRTGRVR